MCNGDMSIDRVSDSKPNAKDSVLKGDINYLDAEYDGDYDDYGHDDVYYQDDEAYAYP